MAWADTYPLPKQHGSIWPGYELISQRIKTKARSHRATQWPPKDLYTEVQFYSFIMT